MGSNAYIYASTRAKVLEQKLLTENQMERLLSAKSVEEAFMVLQDTYLAPYLASRSGVDVVQALDESIVHARKTLASIAPDPTLLDVLWIKYDFHNLKAIIKGTRARLSREEILARCFHVGVYEPEKLMRAYEDRELNRIEPILARAAERAEAAKEIFLIDAEINAAYFTYIKEIAEKTRVPFVCAYVKKLIDLFNLKAALRALAIPSITLDTVFVEGGTIGKNTLIDREAILRQFTRLGSETHWVEAVREFRDTNNYYPLEKAAEEHFADFVRVEARNLFSPAPLFNYFQAQKNNAQIIGAIFASKQAGMPEKEVRKILRRLHQ